MRAWSVRYYDFWGADGCVRYAAKWRADLAAFLYALSRPFSRSALVIETDITLPELMPADAEAGSIEMMARDHARMRQAGGDLAEAAIRVIHDYDGLHRLSLAVARWAEAIAAEGDRPHGEASK